MTATTAFPQVGRPRVASSSARPKTRRWALACLVCGMALGAACTKLDIAGNTWICTSDADCGKGFVCSANPVGAAADSTVPQTGVCVPVGMNGADGGADSLPQADADGGPAADADADAARAGDGPADSGPADGGGSDTRAGDTPTDDGPGADLADATTGDNTAPDTADGAADVPVDALRDADSADAADVPVGPDAPDAAAGPDVPDTRDAASGDDAAGVPDGPLGPDGGDAAIDQGAGDTGDIPLAPDAAEVADEGGPSDASLDVPDSLDMPWWLDLGDLGDGDADAAADLAELGDTSDAADVPTDGADAPDSSPLPDGELCPGDEACASGNCRLAPDNEARCAPAEAACAAAAGGGLGIGGAVCVGDLSLVCADVDTFDSVACGCDNPWLCACLAWAGCVPETGLCGETPSPDGTPCEDGDPVTDNDQCQSGACVCVADCAGRACGDDGCGGSCGECACWDVCDEGLGGCVVGGNWARRYGGEGDDAFLKAFPAADGGFTLLGSTSSSGTSAVQPWIVRTDPTGNVIWQVALPPTFHIEPRDAGVGPAGEIVLVAGSRLNPRHNWIVAVDDTGEVLWQTPVFDSQRVLLPLSGGGFATGGDQLDGYPTVNMFSGEGSHRWTRRVDTQSGPTGNITALAEMHDGAILAAGHADMGFGGSDIFVLHVSAGGAWVDSVGLGGSDHEHTSLVREMVDGTIMVAGKTRSFGGGTDGFLVRLRADMDGPLWAKRYGGSLDESFSALTADADGSMLVVGATNSYGAGGQDGWVLLVSEAGDVLLQVAIGGPGDDELRGVVQSADGDYLFFGRTASFGALGSDALLLRLSLSELLSLGVTTSVVSESCPFGIWNANVSFVALGIGDEETGPLDSPESTAAPLVDVCPVEF